MTEWLFCSIWVGGMLFEYKYQRMVEHRGVIMSAVHALAWPAELGYWLCGYVRSRTIEIRPVEDGDDE